MPFFNTYSLVRLVSSWTFRWTVTAKTRDPGSQYHFRWVGRGSQSPSTPNTPPNPPSKTDTYTKSFGNACFPTFRLMVTDKGSFRIACKQQKQVTWGHNIIAEGWVGAAKPHPHPITLPTQAHTELIRIIIIWSNLKQNYSFIQLGLLFFPR